MPSAAASGFLIHLRHVRAELCLLDFVHAVGVGQVPHEATFWMPGAFVVALDIDPASSLNNTAEKSELAGWRALDEKELN